MRHKKAFLVISILAVILTQRSALALGEWSQADTARELYFLGFMVNDWKQTIDISKSKYRRENNKILGARPKQSNVNLYFTGCFVGHAIIAYALPAEYRKAWQMFWIGAQSVQVNMNNDSGLEQNIGFSYNFNYEIKF